MSLPEWPKSWRCFNCNSARCTMDHKKKGHLGLHLSLVKCLDCGTWYNVGWTGDRPKQFMLFDRTIPNPVLTSRRKRLSISHPQGADAFRRV